VKAAHPVAVVAAFAIQSSWSMAQVSVVAKDSKSVGFALPKRQKTAEPQRSTLPIKKF